MIQDDYNCARYRPGQLQGHYESYFQRANHPDRPCAFWIRYTLFSPEGRPDNAVSELWAAYFDGETGRHMAIRQAFPIGSSAFAPDRFHVQIEDSELGPGRLHGHAAGAGHRIDWNLRYAGEAAPVFMLPLERYAGRFPRAKAVVGWPMASYTGELLVDGRAVRVENWTGSQNHNWGSRHTDRYAYGQVCGFDNAPHSFLEMATGRLRLGPLWTPAMTPLVLRHAGREYRLNGLVHALRARARYDYFEWRFRTGDRQVRIEGVFRAPRESFVGLRYANPPGGYKYCLNSKIAQCTLTLSDRMTGRTEVLHTAHRAAFEILTDDLDHGVEMRN